MLKKSKMAEVVPGAVEGARSATGSAPGAAAAVKRWSANRKKQVVLRLLRGEPVDAISREVSVPIYRLEEWRERALAGIDAGLKERENDPLEGLCSAGLATHRGNTRACFHIWDNARIENPIFCHALQRTTEVRRATQAAQTKLRSPELV